jgi:hypothetical protein
MQRLAAVKMSESPIHLRREFPTDEAVEFGHRNLPAERQARSV